MFGDRPQFHYPAPLQPVQPVAAPTAYGRSARRAQIIILLASLVAVFMLAAVVSFLRQGDNPGQTPAVVVEEDKQPEEDEAEEPPKTSDSAFNHHESFVGDGSTFAFQLDEKPQATSEGEIPVEVLVNGLSTPARIENRIVTFDSPPSDGAEIKISYIVADELPVVVEPKPTEPEVPEEPVLIIKEVPAVPAHPRPPAINIDPPEPEEPEPPISPGDNIDQLYPGIDQEVKDLANALRLTDNAKRILYDHDPKIFEDPTDPDYICGTGQPNTIIYGCWSVDDDRQDIHLLRSPSIQTTLAHELLHAIYYKTVIRGEEDDLHGLLDEVRQAHPTETAEFLEFYQHHYTEDPKWNRFLEYSEIHSFIGSQFRDLPDELGAHYNRHFKDRGLVIDFYDDWHSSVQAKTEENGRIQEIYDHQLAQWQACLNDGQRAQACRTHRPEGQAYQDYNTCLISYKTLMSECLKIKPPEVEYQLAGQEN